NLAPIELHEPNENKKIVRGVCYSFFPEKGFGFMRFMKELSGGLWITDSRKTESPYDTAFAHSSHFPDKVDLSRLPNREMIFEFELKEVKDKGWQAENIKLVEY
ncbi:MAG: NYN domain-containing protein, partial [Candidatus Cloacimonetes bacterium]|nr:NYN domain-containing protein [Candidatus Cloacimonadota bacterium]